MENSIKFNENKSKTNKQTKKGKKKNLNKCAHFSSLYLSIGDGKHPFWDRSLCATDDDDDDDAPNTNLRKQYKTLLLFYHTVVLLSFFSCFVTLLKKNFFLF